MPEKTYEVGIMLKYAPADWIIIWAKRYENSYTTNNNSYPVFVVRGLTEHEVFTLIAEYIYVHNTRNPRVLYKYYSQSDHTKILPIDKFPMPLIDIYLSCEL